MGILDGIWASMSGPARQATVSFASVAKSDDEPDLYEEDGDFNSAWRYYDSALATAAEAERALTSTPVQSFVLWNDRTDEANTLFLTMHVEPLTFEHHSLGHLVNGWSLLQPCGKKTCAGMDCESCYSILHLDEVFLNSYPQATLGLRRDHNNRASYLEHVAWWVGASPSIELVVPRAPILNDMRCVHHVDASTSTSIVTITLVRASSTLCAAGITRGFRLLSVDETLIHSVHGVAAAVTASNTPFVRLHLHAPGVPSPMSIDAPTLMCDTYQVTFAPLPSRGIEHLGDVGLRFRKIMDTICVVDVSGYAASRHVRRGSLVLRINGTRTPFLSFDRLSEFTASSAFFRLPLTLDLVALPQETYFIDREKALISASLAAYQMAKVAEHVRIHLHTLQPHVLCAHGLADAFDTSAFASLGPNARRAILPFVAPRMLSNVPIPADMVRLLGVLKAHFGRTVALGNDAIEVSLLIVYSLCYVEEVSVHREAVHAFRELIKMVPMACLLEYVLPLVSTLKSNSKTLLRAASVSLWLEFLRRLQTQAMLLDADEDERMPGISMADMDHLRWRHQVLEAGVAFAELSSDLEPAVSCSARQHLTSLVQELIVPEPADSVHWCWLIPLVEALSKALMPDGRLDALHLTYQLAPWTSPDHAHWRWRLALVFASLANDGNDLIRKVAAQKFVSFVEYLQIQDLSALYDATTITNAPLSPQNSLLEMSDIRHQKKVDDDDRPRGLSAISWLGSASIDSDGSDLRRRCMSLDSLHQITAGDSTHHVLFALIDGYMNLMHDAPTEIKKIVCRNVGRVAELFGHEILVKFLVPTIQDVIAMDMDDCKCHGSSLVYDSIHHILTRELCRLSPLFVDDPDGLACDVLPFLVGILTHPTQHTHIVVEILENLDYLGFALGKATFLAELGPVLCNAMENAEWKVRVAVAYNLGPLARWLGASVFMQHFQKLVETLSQDLVYQVRNLALQPLQLLVEQDGPWRTYALGFVTSVLVAHANYQMRVGAILWFAAVREHVDADDQATYVVPAIEALATDAVANVRVVCARELHTLPLPEEVRMSLVATFCADADMDVQFFAKDT
ncbi:hypothetical protein SPRG_07324 [Saprolegnia parasitica CBS 223.65]|uniref:Uncharacterized protein n=1 Tax=Saprolegnia parasitica (strain CBS 223.65) TaxID=695850 RepID=A0A067CEX5_SAPPC|nr:hypothetical protein SPRG_07324 [Saprolegnia parasitica CBS 223.65]KDO27695.1 hypothetical protein SPRG_07324 [Saprolegnia parasitica CBS 223.65]|eukprot:XP_012201504.1 hypothetical protein SPRG_07324 [Saprolegnia parasitica CBS 223.65]